MKYASLYVIFLCMGIFACSNDRDVEVTSNIYYTPEETSDVPETETRAFKLGSSAVQMIPVTEVAFQNGHDEYSIESIVDDVDIISIVPDYYGIPYEIFAEGAKISESHPWTIQITQLAEQLQNLNRPIMLQLGFVRKAMVGRAWDDEGELGVDLTWAPTCYDFSHPNAEQIGDAYVNYAVWMAKQFRAEYIVNFVEGNLYYTECGGASASWDALIDIQNRAYDAIKAARPNSTVYAAFHLESLYGQEIDGWDEEQYQAISKMKYELFGIVSYPFGIRQDDGDFLTPYDLPLDYLYRVTEQHPEENRLAISETGWNSTSISVGDQEECLVGLQYSDGDFAAAYLEFLLNSAHTGGFEIINWFSFRDVLPKETLNTCYINNDIGDPENDACEGDFWCEAINHAKRNNAAPGEPVLFSEVVLKAFGAMGIKEYDGTPKSLMFDRWREELSLPME